MTFSRPILNLPYQRHWKLDEDGQSTNCVVDGRYPPMFVTAVLCVRTHRAAEQMPVDVGASTTVEREYSPTPIIEGIRQHVVDHGMPNGRTNIPIQGALLYHALERLGFVTEFTSRHPKDQQIVLPNRCVIEQAATMVQGNIE